MPTATSRSQESSRRSVEDQSPRLSRKVSTYGGSRAWSEDEEAYLLEARQCKTPYKHIANHLQKTELACRLHFHQLAYGTKRKRRSPSTSSVATTQGSRNPSVQANDRDRERERGHASNRSVDSNGSRMSLNIPGHPGSAPTMRISAISPPSSPPPTQRRRLARSESPPQHDSLRVPQTSNQPASSTIPSARTFSPFTGPESPFPAFTNLHQGQFTNTAGHAQISPNTVFSYTSAPGLLPQNSGSPFPQTKLNLHVHAHTQFNPPPQPQPHLHARHHTPSPQPLPRSPYDLSPPVSVSVQPIHRSQPHLPAPKPSALPLSQSPHAYPFEPSLGTSTSAPPSLHPALPFSPQGTIDPHRLSGIYSRNRHAFWNRVAQEYGGNVSPSALEATFLRQTGGRVGASMVSPTGSLPTPPRGSPEFEMRGGRGRETGVGFKVEDGKRLQMKEEAGDGNETEDGRDGAQGAGCSIASLLTEDKEVWPRARTA